MSKRKRARGFASFALGACLSLAACGGSDSNTQAVQSPVAGSAAPDAYASHPHRHHRHRHRRSEYETAPSPDSASAASAAPAAPANDAYPCDDASFVSVQREFASGAIEGDQLVNVCGPVTRVLASRTTRSGLHGYFFVRVAAGDEIEIVSDLGQMDAPAWPWVRAGDTATVRGRYYYDSASSQGIDWTHHGASGSWPSPGYVIVNGTEYE